MCHDCRLLALKPRFEHAVFFRAALRAADGITEMDFNPADMVIEACQLALNHVPDDIFKTFTAIDTVVSTDFYADIYSPQEHLCNSEV